MKDKLLEDYINYLLTERGSSRNTVESYKNDIEKLLKFLSARKIEVTKATLEDMEKFLVCLKQEKQLNQSSIARLVSAIRGFYSFLSTEEIIESSPLVNLKTPKIRKRLPDVLEVEEMKMIIEKAVPEGATGIRDRAMLELLYSSGLRISELLNLKLSDIFLDEEFLRCFGKGNKERIVPVGSYAKGAISLYLQNSRPMLKKNKDTEILFLNRRGGKLSRMGGWNIVEKYVQLSGVTKKVKPHTFRHSFATHLLEGGADLRVVQEMLGHSSITTTEIYTHIDREHLKEAVRTYHPRG